MKAPWLLLLALALPGALNAAAVSIELRPEVRVGTGRVTLGDVARLTSTDLDLMRLLVDLPVGRVPAGGEAAILQRPTLAGWLRRKTGLADEQLLWGGAEAARVSVVQRRVSGDALAAAASGALRGWLGEQGQGTDAQVTLLPRDIDVPEGRLNLRVRSPGGPLRRRMLVWVDVWVEDRFVRSVPVALEVDVPQGQLLRAAAAPIVQRGQWASVRSGAGAVVTEARVQVLQDGKAGDRVLVRQPGATANVAATVVAPGELEIAP
jgi:flagella basal body P-ring formation protein FlgA